MNNAVTTRETRDDILFFESLGCAMKVLDTKVVGIVLPTIAGIFRPRLRYIRTLKVQR